VARFFMAYGVYPRHRLLVSGADFTFLWHYTGMWSHSTNVTDWQTCRRHTRT